MLRLLLFRFWPVLLPVLAYWLWLQTVARKARREGRQVPLFRDGPWYRLVLASLAIGVLCFVLWGAESEPVKGKYIPPHLQNGTLIPGHVEPNP